MTKKNKLLLDRLPETTRLIICLDLVINNMPRNLVSLSHYIFKPIYTYKISNQLI